MKRTLLTAFLIAWCQALGNATDGPVYHTKTYAKLLRKLDGGIVDASSRSLNFLYYEEYATSSTTCELRIFNAQSDLLSTTNLNVTPGSNLVEFNLSSTSLYPGGQKYWIKVTNKKGEKFFLRFKI